MLIYSSGTTRTTRTRHALEQREPPCTPRPFSCPTSLRHLLTLSRSPSGWIYLAAIMSFWSAFSSASKEAPKPEGVSRAQHICQQQLRPGSRPARPADSIYCCPVHAGPSGPAMPPQPTQMGQSKPVPVGHASLAHPQHHEGPTDLDLYRTFSPSDVGMWSWQATTGERGRDRSAALLLLRR